MVQLDTPPAPFWPRTVAWLVDVIIFVVVGFLLGAVIDGFLAAGAALLLYLAYSAVAEGSHYHATFGKYLFELHVADLSGHGVSRYRSIGRAVAKLVSHAVFPFGHLIVSFTDDSQALHDLLASTVVVRGRSNP